MRFIRTVRSFTLFGCGLGAIAGWFFSVFTWSDPVTATSYLTMGGGLVGAIVGALVGVVVYTTARARHRLGPPGREGTRSASEPGADNRPGTHRVDSRA